MAVAPGPGRRSHRILNDGPVSDTGAREPEHAFHQPVPIAARIVWADDGEAAGMRSPMGSGVARVS